MTKEMLRYAIFILLSMVINLGAIFLLIQFDSPSPPSETAATHIKLIKKSSEEIPKAVKTVQKVSTPSAIKTPTKPKRVKEKPAPKKVIQNKTVHKKSEKKPKNKIMIKKDLKDHTDKALPNIAVEQKPTQIEQKQSKKTHEDNVKKTVPLKPSETVAMLPPSVDYNKLFAFHEVDIKPQVTHSVKPLYPMFAKRRHIEGELLLQFIVDKRGDVKNIEIISAEPADVFNENTLKAVQEYKFSPGRVAGIPVQTKVELPVRFTLNN